MTISIVGSMGLTTLVLTGNCNDVFRPLVKLKSIDKHALPIGLLLHTRPNRTSADGRTEMSPVPTAVILLLRKRHPVGGIQLCALKE